MALPGVEKVERIQKPYKLVSRETKKEDTTIDTSSDSVKIEAVQRDIEVQLHWSE